MIGDKLPFRLYPEEGGWWSQQDYQAVMDITSELRPKRVIEFGPGSSTLALLEGGAQRIDTCENNEDWAQVYDERLVLRFPTQVWLHRYTWAEPLSVPALDAETFDLALVDGPRTHLRIPVLRYCLERCQHVLAPTEDEGRIHESFLRPRLRALAEEFGRDMQIIETGPLSGGFALLSRKS